MIASGEAVSMSPKERIRLRSGTVRCL